MLIPADSKEDLERPSTPTDSVFTPPDSQLGSPTPSVTIAGSAIDELDLHASQQHVQVSNEKFRIKGKEKVIASVESKTTYSEVPSLTPESKTNVKLSTRKDAASFRSMYNASPSPDPEPAPVPRITPSPSSQSPRGAAARPSRGRRTSTWYSAKDETPPVDEPFFDARFQAKFKRGLGLAKTVAETINSCDLVKDEGSELHRLWKTAVDLQNFQTPTSCRIGVVGDSGVGKSSLVNSLLDVGQIADTGDVGAACTSLVTEYRPRTQAQKENFTIEVDFMTQAEIDEQLEDLLSSHRYPYFCEHDRNSAEEKAKIEEKSKLAWSSLDAAFGDRADLTESFLQDDADGAFDRILKRLKDWSDDIEWPGQGEEGSSEGTWLSTANTAEECQQKTSAFMKDRLWPFTKVVRVFLSAQILKSGVILADLPGFHDANLARAKAAQQYLHTCDQIFVVAGIARVITNKNVDEIMQDQLGHGMQNAARARGVALVCTKSDDIDQEAQIKFFKKTINLEEINDLRETIEDAEDSNDHEGVLQAQAELRNLFMETRNAHVRKQLLAMFTKIFSTDKEVHIFCVSNKLYKDNLRAGGKAGSPGNRARESITKSGIPALRRFCHTIPAQAQYRSANHFLQSKLPGYLRSLENWLAGNSQVQQNLQGAQAIIDRIGRELEEILHHSIDSIKEELTCINSFRLLGGDSGRMLSMRAANVLEDELQTYHSSQMAAFCCHYGCHSTPKKGFRNWNESIISESRRVTSREWGQIELQYETALQSLGTSLRAYLNELSPTIQDFEGSECFIESLDNHILELREALEYADKGAVESLSKIKFDATQTHLSSYLLTEMIPTYRLAIQDHGNGVTQRRITTLVGRLQQGDIFHRIRQRIMHNLDLLARAMTESLERRIGGIFADVRGDLNALNGSEAVALKREPAFRVLLVRKLTEWQREVDGFQSSSSSEETSIAERTQSSRGH